MGPNARVSLHGVVCGRASSEGEVKKAMTKKIFSSKKKQLSSLFLFNLFFVPFKGTDGERTHPPFSKETEGLEAWLVLERMDAWNGGGMRFSVFRPRHFCSPDRWGWGAYRLLCFGMQDALLLSFSFSSSRMCSCGFRKVGFPYLVLAKTRIEETMRNPKGREWPACMHWVPFGFPWGSIGVPSSGTTLCLPQVLGQGWDFLFGSQRNWNLFDMLLVTNSLMELLLVTSQRRLLDVVGVCAVGTFEKVKGREKPKNPFSEGMVFKFLYTPAGRKFWYV